MSLNIYKLRINWTFTELTSHNITNPHMFFNYDIFGKVAADLNTVRATIIFWNNMIYRGVD
jgi:hypothetical protein